jgi:hypothetical protein
MTFVRFWTKLICSEQKPGEGVFEHGQKTFKSVNGGEFFEKLSEYQLLKNKFAS